ncbi:protein-glutamate O-methyltransferase CheR [Polynucleobacter sp. AP-Reno-20A-A9]|uniref:CheR family methyltransferase n=1 Tax=Polynucleobacter sp. AP-Reno-20A-A9 TaxID=2576925 RepID=UPI001C0ACE9A|nr:CheR family methyltransferase [Polynucleobacter sp. AP-Reno-20A-A9]MBU3629097.1 hypothetical protein [Polynucleobacter sp. AP-Reno-20A-A9]
MNSLISIELIQKIRDLTGLRVTEFDHEKLSLWVGKRLGELLLKNAGDYLNYLGSSNDLSLDRQMLSELLTTGETFFMRDPGQMSLIRREILPRMIAKKAGQKKIRIWAPACATGEEVYSLIILLEEVLGNDAGWDIDVIGSDINPEFIRQAKLAVYREWAFRGCDQNFKKRYFDKTDEGWRLMDRIRSRVRFLVLDLVSGQLPDSSKKLFDIDFILCRNLFIYMNLDAINLVTDKLSSCLLVGGVMITAHGELHAYRQSGLRVKIYPESLVYEKAGELNPPDPIKIDEPWIFKSVTFGQVEDRTNKTPEVAAKASLKPIQELMEDAWYLADRARFNEALDICREILARDSMLAELHYLHAVISIEMGDVDRAKEELRKTLYLDANFIAAYLELITLQIQEGKNSVAAKYCEQALRSLELLPRDIALPGLRNSSPVVVKEYLSNLQKSLTSPL